MTPPAGPSRLDALLAALAELPPADRPAALRSFLEYTLELAEAGELEHYTFLSECALLAVDSVQDVRLEALELELEALHEPPAKQWGEVVLDVALTFAVQAAILVFWEAAAAGVILVAGQRSIMLAKRAAESEVLAARSAQQAVADRMTALRARLEEVDEQTFLLARGGYTTVPVPGGWMVKPGPVEQFEPFEPGRLGDVVLEYERVADQMLLTELATPRITDQVMKAVEKYEDVALNGASATAALKAGWGKKWRSTIGSEKGGVIVAVSQAVIDGAAAVADGSRSASQQPLLASEVTGRFLDWAGEERLRVVQTYANLRLVLRATSDADLVAGDDYVRYLAVLGTEVVQQEQEVRQRYRAARPAVVRGFEAVFWREYLQANGVLREDDPAQVALLGLADPGELLGDHLILERFQDDPATHEVIAAGAGEVRYQTRRYPGAGRIPDLLAANLFRRYAAPYYADDERAKTLDPFRYEPAKYAGAKIPAADEFWGYPDPAGLRLVDEMRFLVVRFFRDGIPDAPEDVVGTALAAATAAAGKQEQRVTPARDSWLGAQPAGTETDGRGPADATAGSRGAEMWFGALAAVTPPPAGSVLARDLAELKLTVALTDLNQDIQAYVLLDRGAFEAEDTVGRRSKEQVLLQIELERRAVKAEWLALQAQAGDERDRLVEKFQPSIDAVDSWQPGHGWIWYGPEQPRP